MNRQPEDVIRNGPGTSRQRPALRIAVLAVATVLAGFAVIGSVLGWQAHEYLAAQDRASATATGTIVEDGIDDNEDIRVRWTDGSGRAHVQRFSIYDTERYTKGHAFAIAYDPAYPAVKAFPGDPEETSAADDLQVPIGFAGVVGAGLILTWLVRGLLFRWHARRSAHPMVAVMLIGQLVDSGPVSLGNSTWVALADPAAPGRPSRWQRAMWHPAVEACEGRVNVVVHGDARSRRRVVVELPDGTALVPIGRLRHRSPKRIQLDRRSDIRADLRDSFILPAGTSAPPSRRWWRRGLVLSLVGAGIGGAMGLLIGGTTAALPFAAAASTLLVNGWALTGAEP